MSRPVFLVLALVAAVFGAHVSTQPRADPTRHVVVVSLDGFPARALDDPRLPTPALRRLAREGTRALKLTGINPTVTWPTHTTFVTGVTPAVHGVLFNGLLIRDAEGRAPRIEPWRDKRELVRAPTVYDAAYHAGLTTAQVDWVAITNPGTITWPFAERPDPAGAVEREMIARGLVTEADLAGFGRGTTSAWRDQTWTDAAVHILEAHRPNLLLYHLLNLDGVHHAYGPGTSAAATSMAFVDAQLARLLAALDRAGLAGRTTVIVVSDHGFKTARRTIQPNVLFRRAGLIRGEGADARGDAWTMSWGGTAGVYVTDASRRGEILPKVRDALRGLEGLARVLEPGEFAALGYPAPAALDQMADLVLVPDDGYDFSRADTGEPVIDTDATHPGHHGVLAGDPAIDALFVAWGAGVARGRTVEEVRAIDVAPTIAEWLGVPLPTAQGRSIASVLE